MTKKENQATKGTTGFRPKVGIDYRLALAKTRGMGRYVRSVVNVLKGRDDGIDFVLICDGPVEQGFDPGRMEVAVGPRRDYIIFEQVVLPMMADRLGLDAVWCPGNTFPLFMKKRISRFVTIHDLIFLMKDLKDPLSMRQRVGKAYRSLVCRAGIGRIGRIFTDSVFTASEIGRKLGRTDAVYAPVMIDSRSGGGRPSGVLEKLSLKRKGYFFTVSGDAPSKNLASVISAHARAGAGMPLVVSGVSDQRSIERFMAMSPGRVVFTGYVPDDDLFSLYENAACFLFMSLAEGFGIPLLEAMSFGLPIIASNRTSIPEVLGACGVTLDPLDIVGISEAIGRFRSEDFSEMVSRQPSQLEKYRGWEKTAEIIVNAMKGDLKK
jgi:glycosyltransferase involved in cell wall biosynthesis